MGARAVAANAAPKVKPRKARRMGQITGPERQLVAQLVHEHPRELSEQQVNGLARAMRRSPAVVKELVERAKEDFVSQADHYVQVHRQATDQALANGDAKSLGVAVEASQWFLEKVSEQGVRVIEKEQKADTGQRILIGIKIGGIDSPAEIINIPLVGAHDPS